MQANHTNGKDRFLLVEVPKHSDCHEVSGCSLWMYANEGEHARLPKSINLPASMGIKYELIGLCYTLSERQAAQIVEVVQCENEMGGFDRQYIEYRHDKHGLQSAKSSLESLIKSRGMDMDGCFILKQTNP